MKRSEDAVAEGKKAIELLGPLIQVHPQVQAYRKMLAIVNSTLGWLAWYDGDRLEAHEFFVKAKDLRVRLALESASTPNEAAGLAWSLATCPDPKVRDAKIIVYWARKGLSQACDHQQCWLAIGHAYCRDKNTAAEAVSALEKSRAQANGGDAYHWFGLAIAHQNQGHYLAAFACYQRGCRWMELYNPRGAELLPLRAEAVAMLRLTDLRAGWNALGKQARAK